ncbi:alpha/beta-hydrolase [Patellaria atrata CBS 101060]|uniref:Alpha/beta-hydrolase n=1 Tax=Patellaria atrata CBS 101060 TaxID=1346257 RepID=A0A9P4S2L5_9PEZI|nr:alpha/beta-hydrolase [Patellaria atrata CBS 101060]
MVHKAFHPFDITDVAYKTVQNHEVLTSILIPKTITPGKYPLGIRFHGGSLVHGSRLCEWVSPWVLSFAHSTPAIVLCPDYQLLPESNGIAILSDLRDLWAWIHSSLATHLHALRPGLEIDLSRVLVTGESAGGYVATQLVLQRALTERAEGEGGVCSIKALVLHYPMLDLSAPWYNTPQPLSMPSWPTPAPGAVETWLRDLPDGLVISASDPVPEEKRRVMMAAMWLQGLCGKWLVRGVDTKEEREAAFPFKMLERVKREAGSVPPVLVVHGKEDDLVPVEGTEHFVQLMGRLFPDTPVVAKFEPGGHGFDDDFTVDVPVIREGLNFIDQIPGKKG